MMQKLPRNFYVSLDFIKSVENSNRLHTNNNYISFFPRCIFTPRIFYICNHTLVFLFSRLSSIKCIFHTSTICCSCNYNEYDMYRNKKLQHTNNQCHMACALWKSRKIMFHFFSRCGSTDCRIMFVRLGIKSVFQS